jgi:DNA-binding LytR/AlgR family response regulator
MIKAIAVDDEPPALRVIENFSKNINFISLEKSFTRPSEAEKHMRKFPVDLIFLDIQMPSVSGIDFYKSISQEVMVIFTTAFSEYAVEGFNLSAVDYLLKPYTFERFHKAVNKANDYYNYLHQSDKAAQPFIFIRADYELIKIKISDILYIQGLDDYVKIFLDGKRVIVTRMTLKALQEKLPMSKFLRVHRSFIVPVNKIEKVSNKNILVGSVEIPIGGSFEDIVNQFINR